MTSKLDAGQKHMLRLIVKGMGADGWAPVSKPVFQLLDGLPSELVQFEAVGSDGAGRIRLTDKGRHVIYAMDFL